MQKISKNFTNTRQNYRNKHFLEICVLSIIIAIIRILRHECLYTATEICVWKHAVLKICNKLKFYSIFKSVSHSNNNIIRVRKQLYY